jgi:hypothetical protein
MTSKGITRTRLAILFALAALGASPLLSAADASPDGAKPNVETTPPAEPAPAAPAAPAQAKPGEPAAQAAEGTPTEGDAPQATTDAAPVVAEPADEKAADATPPEEKPVEPVTGAFGLTLGTRFEPSQVEKVLSEEPKSYRVADKSERQGTLYRVVPKSPDPNFTGYAVATTEDGTIYRIRGELSGTDRRSQCAVTKEIAAALAEKHGKPRGKGGFGEWYAFRDQSAPGYRGILVNAARCKRGSYSISYEDTTFTSGVLPGNIKTEGEPAARKRVTIDMSQRPAKPEPFPETVESPASAATPESAETQEPAVSAGSVESPAPAPIQGN